MKLDKSLALTVEKALANGPGSGNFFDRTSYSGLSVNETRWGLSKQPKW